MLGGSVPNRMLRILYLELSNDPTKSNYPEFDERIFRYCLSKGDSELWPDLRSAINGNKEMYSVFYSIAQQVIDGITGADDKRYSTKRHISRMHSEFTSIPALYDTIVSAMRANEDKEIANAPVPSQQLLRISLCPQYESREVSKLYTC